MYGNQFIVPYVLFNILCIFYTHVLDIRSSTTLNLITTLSIQVLLVMDHLIGLKTLTYNPERGTECVYIQCKDLMKFT